MQRGLSVSFFFISLGLVVLVQTQGPHHPDHGPHETCIDALECHCDPHAPDNMPVCEDGHCSCHHSCTHNHECHCDPPSHDIIPTCKDGQCTCQQTDFRCAHNEQCHIHCEPHGPDHAPVCTNGQCSCHHAGILDADRCTHNDECHLHCEPHGPDHKPVCMDGHCSCHQTDWCIHNEECHIHCEPHGPDHAPVCTNGQCSCHHAGICVHNYECNCDPNSQNNKPMCIDGQCSCHSTAQTSCHINSDCVGSHCSIQGLHPFCRTSLANGQSYCDCTACTEDNHCASKCGSGGTPKCNFTLVHDYTCFCENIVSASTTTSTSTMLTSRLTNAKGSTTPLFQNSIMQGSSSNPTPTSANTLGKVTTINTQTSTKSLPPSTTLSSNSIYVTINGSDSTPATTKTTTAIKSTTTVPTTARSCHVCGSTITSSPCNTRAIYVGNLQTCAIGSDYCMTDIVHDAGGSMQIYKRCVTEAECRDKWLHQSSDLDYCTNYGSVLGLGDYSCHFCCTSEGCNSKIVPPKTTWYTKS